MESIEYRTLPHAGEYGNLSAFVRSVELSGAAADTLIDMIELPQGCQVTDLDAINDALGASTNIEVGVRYKSAEDGTDDPDYYIASSATATAGTRGLKAAYHPVRIDVIQIITLKVLSAAATGTVTLSGKYIYHGAN